MVILNGELSARREARDAAKAFAAANPEACVTCRGNGGRLLEAGVGLVVVPVLVDATGRVIEICPDCLGAHEPSKEGGEPYRWPHCPRCGAHVSSFYLADPWPCGHAPLQGQADPAEHDAACAAHCSTCNPEGEGLEDDEDEDEDTDQEGW